MIATYTRTYNSRRNEYTDHFRHAKYDIAMLHRDMRSFLETRVVTRRRNGPTTKDKMTDGGGGIINRHRVKSALHARRIETREINENALTMCELVGGMHARDALLNNQMHRAGDNYWPLPVSAKRE